MDNSDPLRFFRYGLFTAEALGEKLQGLDFSMRDKRLLETTHGRLHGYSKTSERHVRLLLSDLDWSIGRSFLDIGCGKGVVLKEAAAYPFTAIAGIEYLERLAEIARNNFRILGKRADRYRRVRVLKGDATKFKNYGNYNTYFLSNPFDDTVLRPVLTKIRDAHAGDNAPYTIIYYHPVYADAFYEVMGVKPVRKYHDTLKNFDTYVYELTGGETR